MALPNFEHFKGTNCAREGCFALSAYVPVLRFYAPVSVANSNSPAEMAFAVALCANCALETKVENFLAEKDWLLIETTFQRGGKTPPDRKRTELAWLPLSNLTLPAGALPPIKK